MREFQTVFCISDVRERCALNICCDRDKGVWAEELNIHEDPSDPISDQQTHCTNKTSHLARGYLSVFLVPRNSGCLKNVNISLVLSWGALAAQYEVESCLSSRASLAFFRYRPRKHSISHNKQCLVRRKPPNGYSENLHKWANASFVFSRRSCNHKLMCVRRRPWGKTQTPMKKMKMLRTLTTLSMKNLSSRPKLLMKFILNIEFMLQSVSWSIWFFCDSEPFC